MVEQIGYRVVGTVTAVKGNCSWGHKVSDKIELSAHNTGGLCGFFYHDIFPKIMMLQFGGSYPWGEEDVMEVECSDRVNAVRMELRREK